MSQLTGMCYGWIITDDKITDGKAKPGTCDNAVGVIGPHGVDTDIINRLKNGEGEKFRMYDDDKEHYYSGRIIQSKHTSGFEPMEDFGAANAGCTEIRYFENHKWTQL